MLGISDHPIKALEWNHRAIKFCEQNDSKSVKSWLGPLYNNTGWTYHDAGEFEKALELFQKNQELSMRANAQSYHVARWSVARCLRSLEKYDEALKIQKSLEAELAKAQRVDGYVFEEIAELLITQEKSEEAKLYFMKAYKDLSKDQWLMKNVAPRMQRMKKLSE